MRKKVLAEKSVKQGLNQFQFVEQFHKHIQKHPMPFDSHRVLVLLVKGLHRGEYEKA